MAKNEININNDKLRVVDNNLLDKVGGQGMNLSVESGTKIVIPTNYIWLSDRPEKNNQAPRARLLAFSVTSVNDDIFVTPVFVYRGQLGRRDAVTRAAVFGDALETIVLRGTLRQVGDFVAGKELTCKDVKTVTSWKFTDKGQRVTDENGNYETTDVNAYNWEVEDAEEELLAKVEAAFKSFCNEYGINKSEEE